MIFILSNDIWRWKEGKERVKRRKDYASAMKIMDYGYTDYLE